ncbi:MAG: tetratricopeptide repeat protein [Alphaproteobacteria bacterium]
MRLKTLLHIFALTILGACVSINGEDFSFFGKEAETPPPLPIQTGAQQKTRQVETFFAPSPAGNYLASLFAYEDGAVPIANEYISTAIDRDPNNVILLEQGLLIYLETGNINDAYKVARRLIEKNPEALIARIVLAHSNVKKGRYKAAEKHLSKIDKAAQKNLPIIPLFKAWIFAGQKRQGTAIATLEKLRKTGGAEDLYHSHAALIYALFNDKTHASQHFISAVKKRSNPRVFQLIRRVFHFKKGAQGLNSASNQQLSPEALFKKADLNLENFSVQIGMSEALYDTALLLVESQIWKLGLSFGRLSLDLDPENISTQMFVATLLSKTERFDAANTLYDKISISHPFYKTAQIQIVENLKEKKDFGAAIKRLERLKNAFPGDIRILTYLGDLSRQQKHYRRALRSYSAVIEQAKKLSGGKEFSAEYWLLFYNRGVVYERLNQWEKAERDLLMALKLQPDQPEVLNYLGYSWVDRGINLNQGQKMLERAVELSPGNGFIIDSLGWALFKQKKYKSAVSFLERSVELVPNDPVISGHLGDAFWKNGRKKEATFQWQRALDLHPEKDLIPELKDKIEHGI